MLKKYVKVINNNEFVYIMIKMKITELRKEEEVDIIYSKIKRYSVT